VSGTDLVTFGLAYLGYVLLCIRVVARAHGRASRLLALATALVVAAHVACVWTFRFDWSLTRALDKSVAGFVVFHTALLLVLIASLADGRAADRALFAAFAVVSCGALPAPFRYEEIRLLALPMLAAFTTTALLLARCWRRRRRA
jgi:hypothetical protein